MKNMMFNPKYSKFRQSHSIRCSAHGAIRLMLMFRSYLPENKKAAYKDAWFLLHKRPSAKQCKDNMVG
jgi:hypothetical protein